MGELVKTKNSTCSCSIYVSFRLGRRVTLIAENSEDMWHAYNLITPSDTVRASTIRLVQLT